MLNKKQKKTDGGIRRTLFLVADPSSAAFFLSETVLETAVEK